MTNHGNIPYFIQQRIQSHAVNSDSYSFFNLLTGPDMLSKVEELLPDTYRERQFPPTETLSMFMAQALSEDRSCQKVVNDASVKRIVGGLTPCSTATGGYCLARKRLSSEMISTLTRYTGELINCQLPDPWRWQGKRVLLVDGTTLTMPDTAENQAMYPQQSGQKPGLGFPICRLVGIICLAGGALLNAATGPCKGKGSGEQTLLRSMLNTFEEGDLVLGDAYFGTYVFLPSLLDKGVDAVFEQLGARKRATDFRKGQQLGARDHLISLEKPKRRPDWMSEEDYDSVLADVLPRQLSFKHTVQLWLAWEQQMYRPGSETDDELLFVLIAQKIVGKRPGRIEPRAVKRRPKPFPLLMEKRALARARIKINGHPKKA